jgi:hydrogenase maturation protease
MTQPSILVAGIGNIFMGDDAFGLEVVRRLVARALPDCVRVVDFGIRGFDLAYALMDGQDVTILVDATPRGGDPGTIYTIEPNLDEIDTFSNEQMAVEPHGMNPMKVLAMVKSMAGAPKRILLVGCEPATLGPEEGLMGLSVQVEAAVDETVPLIESLIAQMVTKIQRETSSECGATRASTTEEVP